MRNDRKIERRRFLRSLAGLCALLTCDSSAVFGTGARSRIEPLALLTALHHQVRIDFELGRTIEVDGWILSETETVLCKRVSRTNPDKTSRRRPGTNRPGTD